MAFVAFCIISIFAISIFFIWLFYKIFGFNSGFLKEKSKNPFSLEGIQPPGPLVTDQTERNAVLKQGFATKKIPSDLDAIVIGSGIGSLAAAALLSKAGWKVLVLEQHDQAGGCCHSFEEKGFEFDVGIHYVGKLLGNTEFRNFIDQITNGKLQWDQIDDNYDTVCLQNDGKNIDRYKILAGKKQFETELIKKFPEEEDSIRKFVQKLDLSRKQSLAFSLIKTVPLWLVKVVDKLGILNMITPFFKDCETSLQELTESLTSNKKLQAVMSYCFGDYGALPRDAPWPMQAMLMTHFWYGAAYPRGGASEIAFNIIPTIEASGGKVLVRAPVTDILLDGRGRACGVTVLKGGEKHSIGAPVIISGAGIVNTFGKMIPKEVAIKSRYYKYINQVGSGHAAMQLFVGLNGTKKELELPGKNFWCFLDEDLDGSTRKYLQLSADEARMSDTPLMFLTFPSAKDSSWELRHPGKSVATIVTFTNYEWFKEWENQPVKKRDDSYEQFKEDIQNRLWEQVLLYFPQLRDKVEYMNLGSPLSHQYYIGCDKGEIYGLDHGKKRFTAECVAELRSETDIPGLYLTGQDICACGFSGAAYGGLFCASVLLKRNLFLELIELKKAAKKLEKTE